MTRRSTEAAEARRVAEREAIVAAARRNFFDEGYFAATLSAIAAEIGGSKGRLWRHFKSKADLFSAVVDQETFGYHDDAVAILTEDGNPYDLIERFAGRTIERMTSRETITLRRLMASVAGQLPIGDFVYGRLVQVLEDALTEFYARHASRGALHIECPRQAATLTIALCGGSDQSQFLWTSRIIDTTTVARRSRNVVHLLKAVLTHEERKTEKV